MENADTPEGTEFRVPIPMRISIRTVVRTATMLSDILQFNILKDKKEDKTKRDLKDWSLDKCQ